MPYLFPKVPCFDDYHTAAHEFIAYFCSYPPEAFENMMVGLNERIERDIDHWMESGGRHFDYSDLEGEPRVHSLEFVPPAHRYSDLCRAEIARIAKAYLSGRRLIEIMNYGSNLPMAEYQEALNVVHEEQEIHRFLVGISGKVGALVEMRGAGDHPIELRRRHNQLIAIIRQFSKIDASASERQGAEAEARRKRDQHDENARELHGRISVANVRLTRNEPGHFDDLTCDILVDGKIALNSCKFGRLSTLLYRDQTKLIWALEDALRCDEELGFPVIHHLFKQLSEAVEMLQYEREADAGSDVDEGRHAAPDDDHLAFA